MTSVAVIGNHAHSFCSEAQWARAFAANGCDVTPFQIEEVVADPVRAMDRLRHFDLVSYTRTHSHGRYLAPEWAGRWRELEREGVQTIGLHLDRFWDLDREHLVHDGDAQFTVGTLWSADGGNDDRWAEAGVQHRWLIPGIDAEMVGEHTFRPDFAVPVVFVGSEAGYHAEYEQREELIAYLRGRFGSKFARYGAGTTQVRGVDLAAVYASAGVVVGDSCFANSPDSAMLADRYFSDRLPEVLGRAGFLAYPYTPGLPYEFGRDLCGYTPGDFAELGDLIEDAWALPDHCRKIARQGMAHVREHHTWQVRMRTILDAHGLLRGSADTVTV